MYKSIAYAREDGDHDLIATLNNSGGHLTEQAFRRLTELVAGFVASQVGAADVDVLDRQDAPDVVTTETH
jgi:hypothetical protein